MNHEPAWATSIKLRIRAVPFVLRLLHVLAAFGLVGYWVVTDSGLYRMFRSGPAHTATQNIFYPRAALGAVGVVMAVALVSLLMFSTMFANRNRQAG